MPTRLPHRRAFKSPLLNVLVGVMTASVLFITWAVVLVGASEAYCGFMPDVDTRFASGFTEAGFNRIGAGMDSAQVAAVLGEPYTTSGY
jgi:outer membrane protein assembly factor BamE (lipoprotein component of BamABCDE complex)